MSKMNPLVKYLAYGAFSFFSFFLFLYATFPSNELFQHTLLGLIDKWSHGDIVVKAQEVSMAGISGLRLRDVNIFVNQEGDAAPMRIALDMVQLKINLFATILKLFSAPEKSVLGPLGGIDITLKQGAEQGELDLSLSESSEGLSVKAKVDSLDLKKMPALKSSMPLPFEGLLSAQLDIETGNKLETAGQGSFSFTLSKAAIGAGQVDTPMGPLSRPTINMGEIGSELKLEKGQMSVVSWKQHGSDLSKSTLSGKIRLQPKFKSSKLDLKLGFAFAEQFLEQQASIKTMLQIGGLRADSSGLYTLTLSGSLASPTARELRGLKK